MMEMMMETTIKMMIEMEMKVAFSPESVLRIPPSRHRPHILR
jgi:hypothetical protein